MVASSTTLGHLATLPVIVEETDAVILDLQVHSSIQMTVQMLKARKIPVYVIRHNCMESLEAKIKTLSGKHPRIWYMADGVYSMYGDYAPLNDLVRLLNKYKKFHLYIDDAHGMGWAGKNGCGYVRSQIEHHERMVLAVSLNKSFGAAGGAIVFPNEKWENLVRNCGATMIFCGPIQPPMLGAACASARLHLSPEIETKQAHLAELIDHCNKALKAAHLPQYCETDSPLFFVPVGIHPISVTILTGMMEDGFYLNAAAFPAVPMKKGGIRFMINATLTKADITNMVSRLKAHYMAALELHGSSCEKVATNFGIPFFHQKSDTRPTIVRTENFIGLKMEMVRSVVDLNTSEWNRTFSGIGNLQSTNLEMLEKVFSNQQQKENNWDFFYLTIRDKAENVVLQTFFSFSIVKDDMLSPAHVSQQVEETRKENPDFLTSGCVMLGSPITKGEHLFLNRNHPEWKKALKLLVEQMQETVSAKIATKLMLREFTNSEDEELKDVMLDLGLVALELPDVLVLNDLTWGNRDEYLQRLSGKYRYNVRKEVLAFEDRFTINTRIPNTKKEIQEVYDLYTQVFDQALDLNVFKLPMAFFETATRNPDYDFMRLYLKNSKSEKDASPVAAMVSCINQGTYNALIVGLDYDLVRKHNTYKQILFQTVMQARELGCSSIDLAFTADLEKKKLGARPQKVCAYVQAIEHYSAAVLHNLAS